MKGTLLDQMRSDYSEVLASIQKLKLALVRKKELLPDLKSEFRLARQKLSDQQAAIQLADRTQEVC